MAPTLRVVRAVYDYEAQEDDELSVVEGELLHVIGDADEPGWLVCARKVDGADDMVGNVPENYVEEPTPLYSAPVLYDYDALNEDELTVYESATIDVFEELPDDWVVARLGTAYGLVPANYIDRPGHDDAPAPPAAPAPAPPAPAAAAAVPPPVIVPSA
ncbi:hypothetical protein AMAG_04203 [Allomyces macrogynus ATCC 38327]|uniref:SH3 domain-containing protein n=1 Tax=Allomyces macrogynus (strain ATCC 38327) TaxID=578462 RepID=A0A0L0S8B2_ALLM3|nr:hypothetical protein AMAG_04203 [Allomyces macrogynus ATCC 38327]|eukprot:KNE58645.1 hypothetical protein AMAG_04203 [Allomyces macrogynus ATCC 38327]